MLGKCSQSCHFFRFILNSGRSAKYNDRPVVHRMMKCGAGKHKPIENCDRHANINTLPQCPQHAAGHRAMDIKRVLQSAICRGNYHRAACIYKTYMAHKSFIQDIVNGVAFILGSH